MKKLLIIIFLLCVSCSPKIYNTTDYNCRLLNFEQIAFKKGNHILNMKFLNPFLDTMIVQYQWKQTHIPLIINKYYKLSMIEGGCNITIQMVR